MRLIQLADWRRNLPMAAFCDHNSSVKLVPLSVAIALALALSLAPLARAIADQRCDMLGRSASEAKNCHGCCDQMKCCPVSKQEEKAQSTQPISSNRSDSGFGSIVAVALRDSLLLWPVSVGWENYRSFRTSSSAPTALSLARLCIRLIWAIGVNARGVPTYRHDFELNRSEINECTWKHFLSFYSRYYWSVLAASPDPLIKRTQRIRAGSHFRALATRHCATIPRSGLHCRDG